MTDQYDDPFAGSDFEKTPSLKFPTIGTVYSGVVTDPPKLVQQREYKPTGDGPPAFWDKEQTQPKMAVVINLLIDEEKFSLWVPKPSAMFAAVGAAQTAAEARILPGGTLSIKYTHEAPTSKGFMQKQYAVKYKPGAPTAQDDPWADSTPAAKQPVSAGSEPPF